MIINNKSTNNIQLHPTVTKLDNPLSTEEIRETKPNRAGYYDLEKHPITVVLDGLCNSHNIGSILRLSEALLLEKVILCGEANLSSKRIRKTSCGAEKWINLETTKSTKEQCKLLRKRGYSIVAVELSKMSLNYQEITHTYPVAFVFGSERDGIKSDILSFVDKTIHLPMYGFANSLNVSSAASVI